MHSEDVLKKSIERSILHFEKWNKTLSKILWILFSILFVLEVFMAVVYCTGTTLGFDHSLKDYLIQYLFIPSSVVFITIFLAQIINSRIMVKFSEKIRSRFLILATIIMVSEVVALHHGINVVFILYTLPIIISIIFVDKFTLFLTYIACVLSYLLIFFVYIKTFVPDTLYSHNYMDIIATIGILTAVFILSLCVYSRIRELINTTVDYSIKEVSLAKELKLDSLTGLFNHATFYEKLDDFIMQYRQEDIDFAIIIMDIDNFKVINCTYGRDMGDMVLLRLVDIINENISKNDISFRYGGEEFTIITTNVKNANNLAENIRDSFFKYEFPDISHPITISMGICVYDDSYGGRREFFSAADQALNKSKKLGKNRITIA